MVPMEEHDQEQGEQHFDEEPCREDFGAAGHDIARGTILIFNSWACVLFDTGASHSLSAYSFAKSLGLEFIPVSENL